MDLDETNASFVGTVKDNMGGTARDVRLPKAFGNTTTLTESGVYYLTSNANISLGSMAAGTVITIYNNSSGSITLNRGSMSVMRKAANNANTNHASAQLARFSTTTVTAYSSTFAVVSGTDVS